MKVVAISDLHGYLPKDLPEGDVLCICGDTVPLEIQRSIPLSVDWFTQYFIPWVNGLQFKKVILVAGNHDYVLEHTLGNSAIQNIVDTHEALTYLKDESITLDGIKFYGTPWCPNLRRWAFYGDSLTLEEKFNAIPDDTKVLLTHSPIPGSTGASMQTTGRDFGCNELLKVLESKNIPWVLSGHVHSGNHNVVEYKKGCNTANVSLKDEYYNVTYKPFVFEIN